MGLRRPFYFALVVALAAAALVVSPRARAAAGYTLTEAYIESSGGVRLQAFVYRSNDPATPAKVPVLLTVTPYAGTGGNFVDHATGLPNDPLPMLGTATPAPGEFAERMIDHGYAYVVVSLRGYGGSGGCTDFGGPGEQADVAHSIRWAAEQPWSDGNVGMIGHSYPGQTGLMGLASHDPALKAVVAGAPPAGYHNLYTNEVPNFVSGPFYPAVYVISDLYGPSVRSPAEQQVNAWGGTATHPGCQVDPMRGSVERSQSSDYWVARDLVPKIGETRVATIISQGWNDYQVRPNALADIWRTLRGPRRLVFGPYDHGIASSDGYRAWDDELVGFFDEHLRGIAPTTDVPRIRIQSVDGTWRSAHTWPPPADAPTYDVALLPGSYTDVAGNSGETGMPALWPVDVPESHGQGSWTFTPPLASSVHVSGLGRVSPKVAAALPLVNVIALVYDVDPDGNAQFVTRGAATAGRAGDGFDLYPVDWEFAAGHRIGVLLTGSDDIWFVPSDTGTPVTIAGGRLSFARVSVKPDSALPSGPFKARQQHPPFTVDKATIEARTTG